MCPGGSKFEMQHIMSCKKGGLVTIRHNDLRDLTVKVLSEVCNDTEYRNQAESCPVKWRRTIKLQLDLMKRDLMFEHVILGKEDSKNFLI